jgi:superfamily II DNA or RNA helicase
MRIIDVFREEFQMNLTDVQIKEEYRSLLDDITNEFYIPLLSLACEYNRAVGFFSSTVLCQISDGIAAIAKNGGKIKIVASPYLSDKDIEAIRKGYEVREVIRKSLLSSLEVTVASFSEKRLNLIANLIADDILDIKIAFTENNSNTGIYHEKLGIISDRENNTVVFSGSMNESYNALTSNYEVIDVWCSWKNNEQRERVENKKAAFASIWSDTEPNVKIIDFPEINEEIINRYKRNTIADYDNEIADGNQLISLMPLTPHRNTNTPTVPNGFSFHDYQTEAIDNLQKNNFIGIFDMATGTGKTYTGLGAIVRISETLNNKLAVVIVCPYQHLVEQWVEDIEKFNIKPIIGYSSSPQKNWAKLLENAILDQKLKVKNREFFCFVCTNATFATERVQKLLCKIRGDILLLVDEAHNFGSIRLSNLLSNRYNYRLSLSATLERHGDEEGTSKLLSFFGNKCIEYSLERAIQENKLTRYRYYPIITVLNATELEKYDWLTGEIGKCIIKGKNGKTALSEKGKRLALQRARLVAGAEDKVIKLEEIIQPYLSERNILVYCGATTMLAENQDYSDTNEEDIRQIEAVTRLLGTKLKMDVAQFTSREDIETRGILKRNFADGKLQALIAIKCLDEGVNIPSIKTAFILASTTNPKEYIQRRGRVLRKAEGKEYAEIFDFIALPRALNEVSSLTEQGRNRELSLVKNELRRAEEFARLAMNMPQAEQVIDLIKEAYSINEYLFNFEEDFQDE